MANIWRIFRDDMKRLFSNTVCIIITLGLILIPSIFSWYNVIACWNVFDNTGNLMVAVANCDEGYKSDIVPIDMNIGEKVVSGCGPTTRSIGCSPARRMRWRARGRAITMPQW